MHGVKGIRHYRWKGGIKYCHGYRVVYCAQRPRTWKSGHYPEHRLVYEETNKCCLLPWVHIHHKNGIRDDNRIENLEPMSKSAHTRNHMKGNTYNKFRKYISSDRQCMMCSSHKTYIQNNTALWYRNSSGYVCNICYKKDRHARRLSVGRRTNQ